MDKVIIVGYGGHAKSMLDAIADRRFPFRADSENCIECRELVERDLKDLGLY